MSTSDEEDDSTLVAAWRDGDKAAGRRLFSRYYDPVARFFFNKVGDRGDDLIQRTFLAVLEGLPGLRSEGSFRSYLFAIAYRQLCRHYRTLKGDKIDLTTITACAADPSASLVLVEREDMRLFLAGLREIPIDMQVALELHYWDRCGVAEIATVLDVPEGTIKSRLRRGRELLRAAIERLAARPDLAADSLHGVDTWAQAVRERVRRPPT